MLLDRAGREYVSFPFAADVEDLPGAEVLLLGEWHSATVTVDRVELLVAGPLAGDNPGGTVVLPVGQHWPKVRFTDNPEVVIDYGGVILVT